MHSAIIELTTKMKPKNQWVTEDRFFDDHNIDYCTDHLTETERE